MVPVVLFHAGVAGFSGGYVGVDVFFVISGYLITGHILSDMERGAFSAVDFYERRIRRIFPALAAMVLFTLLVGLFLMTASEYLEAGRAVRSTGYFFSNHLFWETQNNYWNQNALATQPLLHTWSLAVEEQFYIVLPGLLAVLHRFEARRRCASSRTHKLAFTWIFGALMAASLVCSVIWMSVDSAAAFYLLPARSWELLAGGLLAVWFIDKPSRRASALMSNACGFLGLTLVAVPVLVYSESTPFPGLSAIPIVLGTCLLIYAGSCGTPHPWPSRLLALRPLVFVGLISYSLYLWHWPLLVLFRSAGWYGWKLPEMPSAVVLAVVFGISWLSWRFVERPFRRRSPLGAGSKLTMGFGIAVLLAFIAGGSIAIKIGENPSKYPMPLPEAVVRLGDEIRETPGIRCEGNADLSAIRLGRGGCVLGDLTLSPRAPEFVLIGDSHARMWVAGLDQLARELGVSGIAFTYSSCTPVRGYIPPSRPECAAIMDALFDFIAAQPVRRIILAGYWVDSADAARSSAVGSGIDFWSAVEQTATFLRRAGKEVVFVEDVPELANNLMPYRKGIESIKGQGQAAFGPSLAEHLSRQSAALEVFKRMEAQSGIRTLSPTSALCGTGQCMVARDSRTWYRDMHHLTDYGATQLRNIFQTVLVAN